jgi:glycosyltransferase involved in cell wall biosynthesis
MKVTVLIPTYNYAHYIIEAIKSIENQTYPLELIEIIIIDDGSTDETKEALKKHNSVLDIKYIFQKNMGKALATKLGIEKSNGEIIFNLDADDFFLEDKISTVVEIYKANPKIISVGHPAEIKYENLLNVEKEIIPIAIRNKELNGQTALEYYLENRILYGGGSTFSARAFVLKQSEISKEVDMYIDEYLIFSTYEKGNIYIINSYLSVWRVHGGNYSVEKNNTISKNKLNSLLNSSEFILRYVEKSSNLSKRIKELYKLKHLDRFYTSLEISNQKGIKEILNLFTLIISRKYNFNDLKNYRIFNRLLPTFIISNLKFILKKNKH